MSRRRAGFTFVELLVALLLLAAILAGLLALTRATLGFTGLTRAVATSTEDLAETEGYLVDTLRNARGIFGTLDLTIDGAPVRCAVTPDAPAPSGRCLAVLSPVVDVSRVAEPVVDYDLSIFVIEPIGDLYAAAGLERGWEGLKTLALLEYRVEGLCAPAPCSLTPAEVQATVWDVEGPPGFLLGGLSPRDGDDDEVVFFDVQAESSSTVDVRLVARTNAPTGQPFVVRQSHVGLRVTVRP